jgi:glycine oxidase
MSNCDIAFVGNGIISIVSALKLKEINPDLKIAIIGPADRPFSASVAAGAMQAVFCEIEDTFHELPRDREIFSMALAARSGWRALLNRVEFRDAITADDTVMYRRKEATPFEEANFNAACTIASEHGCLEDVPNKELKNIFRGNLSPSKIIAKKFIGEFAIDPKYFFEQAQKILEKMGVIFINEKVVNIQPTGSNIEISLKTGNQIQAQKAIIAAGTMSSKLTSQTLPLLPIFHAVGTALVLDSAPDGYSDLRLVIRTPNRGGAQCGMHIVPRNNGKFYLGAGNYLSDQEPAHRVETIRYLIDVCDEELYGKKVIYNSKGDLLLGSRPKTLDGYPLVGSLKKCPNIFVATGCYRIGLTIAPEIASEILLWVNNLEPSSTFNKCAPDRNLHSYPSLEIAEQYYSESRLSNLIEHGLLDPLNGKAFVAKKSELKSIARNFNANIIKRHGFENAFVADPDMYAVFMAMDPK